MTELVRSPSDRTGRGRDEYPRGGDVLAERLAELVAAASDGQVTAADALAAGVPLSALGFTSLFQLRLVDAVEREFKVAINLTPEGIAALDDVHALAAAITASDERS